MSATRSGGGPAMMGAFTGPSRGKKGESPIVFSSFGKWVGKWGVLILL